MAPDLVPATLTRLPTDGTRILPGDVEYSGPHGPLHAHIDGFSTVVHGSALGEVVVPWGVSRDPRALSRALADEMAIRVGAQSIRAYRYRSGRSRAARAITLQAGSEVLLWRAAGLPGFARLVLERADGALVASLSAQGDLSIDPQASALEVALAVATTMSAITDGAL